MSPVNENKSWLHVLCTAAIAIEGEWEQCSLHFTQPCFWLWNENKSGSNIADKYSGGRGEEKKKKCKKSKDGKA